MWTDENVFCRMFDVRFPIVQAGMVWCSGWKLASAVSNAGGLGTIGAGSMHPNLLKEHILACQHATKQPFAVNVPLLYAGVEDQLDIIEALNVPIVITSAGSPGKHTKRLKDKGIKVIHVVSSASFAQKAQQAGVDAIVAEGHEAGGHNGLEETTTMVLVPLVRQAVDIPVVAAGGIASGKSMAAAMALGADAVQMGSRFICTHESSAHPNFKEKLLHVKEGENGMLLRKFAPVRLLKNQWYTRIHEAEMKGLTKEELKAEMGKGASKRGIFDGDLENGELEVGQVAYLFKEIKPAQEVVEEVWEEFKAVVMQFSKLKLD